MTTIANFQGTNPSNNSFIDQAKKIYESSFKGGLGVSLSTIGKQPGSWLNNLYDDEGWWALAWIQVYDVAGNATYLHAAQDIYADMKAGLSQTTCGGLIWQKDQKSISSIENSIFLDVAAKLAVRVSNGEEDYFSAALTHYQWIFNQSGLPTSSNLIADAINPGTCKPYDGRLLTYNQGSIIGALVSLYKATDNDETYLTLATTIALASISHFSNSDAGILTEDCDPNCDTTAAQFKGVFIRNLASLQQLRPREDIRGFIRRNAESIWSRDRSQGDKLGSAWVGPYQDGDVSAMCSGLDGLVAAVVVGGD